MWIKSTLGNIRVVLILIRRNPARGAAALYWWMVRKGYWDAPKLVEDLVRPGKPPLNRVREHRTSEGWTY